MQNYFLHSFFLFLQNCIRNRSGIGLRKDYSVYSHYDEYGMLSKRELEILKLKNSGKTNAEIAQTLKIGERSVGVYLSKIVGKIEKRYNYGYSNEYTKKRRAEDPEYRKHLNEYARKYYENNREKAAERHRKYQKNNAEKIREYQREYYKNNAEKLREYQREYGLKKQGRQDRISKRIERHKTNARAAEIVRQRKAGKTLTQIAKEQGCTWQNIQQIIKTYENNQQLLESQHENTDENIGEESKGWNK